MEHRAVTTTTTLKSLKQKRITNRPLINIEIVSRWWSRTELLDAQFNSVNNSAITTVVVLFLFI